MHFLESSLVYTSLLALWHFCYLTTKDSQLLLKLIQLFLHDFQRDLRADSSPKYFRGQTARLYLPCSSANDKNWLFSPFKCFTFVTPFSNQSR